MTTISKPRVVVLGAGFGGLELSTVLSETFGDGVDVTLIDKSDAFVFGYSKLDIMFGRTTLDAVRMPYRNYLKAGVRFLPQTVTAIDPERRRVTTDGGDLEADFLVVALGAEYDMDATPGLAEANEFYTVAGAERLRDVLPDLQPGKGADRGLRRAVQVPAGAQRMRLDAARLSGQSRCPRSLRDRFVLPLPSPVPPSPETSRALEAAFAERNIEFIPGRRVASLDNTRKIAILDDGAEMPFDLFLGVPKHHVASVVVENGMAENGWIPVNPRTLETKYPGVYAVGDGANTGTPKAGVFAEGAARAVASGLIAKLRNSGKATQYNGVGTCYIEFGGGRIGKVEVDFFSGPKPTGTYHEPSVAFARTRSGSAPAAAPAGLECEDRKSLEHDPKSCRLFGKDHAPKQSEKSLRQFNLK